MTITPWTSLIRAREAKGWSRFRLAGEMHINLHHLGKLERGEVIPRNGTVLRAAETLGVPVAQVTPGHVEDTNLLALTSGELRELVRGIVVEELDKREA